MASKLSSHWPISLCNGAAALFTLSLPLALVRVIPPDQVGRYKLFFLYVMISPGLFLVGGLSNGLYHWAGKYPQTKQEIRQSWTWLWALTLSLSLLGLGISRMVAPKLKMPLLDLEIFLFYCPFGLACTFLEDLMISRGEIWKGSLYGSGFQFFRSSLTLAAAYWGRRVEYILWAFFGATALRAATGYLMVRSSGDVQPIFSREGSQHVLKYAFPVSLAAFAGVAFANVDQLVLSFRLHPAEFAIYSLGCLSVPPLQILEISVNRVLIPKLSKALAAGQRAAATVLFAEGVSELYRILLPATVGLILFAHPIIRLLFTERYSAAAQYLQFYALFYLFMSVPYDVVARARGDGVWILRLALLFAPLSIAATWLATARWGALGALISFLSVQLALRLYALMYQKRHLAARYSEFLPLQQMLLLTGWVALLCTLCVVSRPLFNNDRSWFLVTGPLFTLCYFAGTYGFILKPSYHSSDPIPVLEIVQFLSVGGLERMVYSLSRVLNQDERFRMMVALYDRLDDTSTTSLIPQFKDAGIPVIQWEKRSGFCLRTVTRLVQIIFSEKRRILHAHDLGPLIYGSLAKYLSFGRVQLVVTLHTLLHIETHARYRIYFKYFLRFADRIIVVSPAVKTGLLALGIDARRIFIVPNGVSFTRPPETLEEKKALRRSLLPNAEQALQDARWMLCLARLDAGKGQDVALDVWRSLPDEMRSQMALIFVGPWSNKNYVQTLKEACRGVPDADRIVMAGPTSCPEAWIQASDLFFSGSRHEGMPLAPLEALGSGLPTVLSNIPGHNFLKPWGHYFALTRPHEGAAQIMEIVATMQKNDASAYFQRQWEAAAPLREKWSETAMAVSYMDVFQSLCDPSSTEVPKSAYAATLQ